MSIPAEYRDYQQDLILTLLKWLIRLALLAFVVNCLWFPYDFWGTLVQNGAALIGALIGWWCLREARRGRMRRAIRVYLITILVAVVVAVLSISQTFILNAATVLYFLALMAAFLEMPEQALYWAVGGIVTYAASLTVRALAFPGGAEFASMELVALYLFPTIFLLLFAAFGRRAAVSLRDALINSASARRDLERSNYALRETQSILEDTNEQLRVELAERQRAEAEIQRHLQEVTLLYETSTLIASAEEVGDALHSLCVGLAYFLQVPQASFARFDDDRATAEILAEHRPPGAPNALGTLLPVADDPSLAYILEHRAPLVVAGAHSDPLLAPVRDAMQRRGVASLLALPVRAGGDVIGALGFDAFEPREFDQADVDLLQHVAHQVGQLLVRKQAEDELRRHQQHLEERVQERTARLVEANRRLQDEISERQRIEDRLHASLQEKEVLLKEIHHRVKNNLQIISSLLGLQSDATQEPQVLQLVQESRRRIRAIALIHERLYRSLDLATIDAAGYLRELVAYLFGVYVGGGRSIASRVEVDDVTLSIDAAIPCGLIVSELVSNALKHAFPAAGPRPSGEEDEIRVRLRAEGDGRFTLTVGDNGRGLPPGLDGPDPQTLGLQLVRLLARQLEGSLEVRTDAGTVFCLSFAD